MGRAIKRDVIATLGISGEKYGKIRELLKEELSSRGALSKWRAGKPGLPLREFEADTRPVVANAIGRFLISLPTGMTHEKATEQVLLIVKRLRESERHRVYREILSLAHRSGEFLKSCGSMT